MAFIGESFSFYYGIKFNCVVFTKFTDESKGDYFRVKQFQFEYELLPIGSSFNLIAKMHNISKFLSNEFMDTNFFYYSI